MADIPRIQSPYSNVTVPMSQDKLDDQGVKVPIGPKGGKLARTALILQGLIGSK